MTSLSTWSTAAARACHRALGCRHYGLFDFRVDPAGTPVFLEAGLYNSFARTSVIAVMAAAAGIDVPELFADAVGQAVRESHHAPAGRPCGGRRHERCSLTGGA